MMPSNTGLYSILVAVLCLSSAASRAQELPASDAFAKIYGQPGAQPLGRSVKRTSDGGYVMTGVQTTTTNSVLILKTDAVGRPAWRKTYTVLGQFSDGFLIQQTSSGYIVAAVLGSPGGKYVLLVLNVNSAGDLLWQKTYPTEGAIGALPLTIEQTADGGYLLGATNYDYNSFNIPPLWALKLDSTGGVVWQKVFGFLSGSIHATADGGYIMAGSPACIPRCLPLVVKLDQSGNISWAKLYQIGTGDSSAGSARQTSDGGYLVAGAYDTATGTAAFLMKLDGDGNVIWEKGYTNSCGFIGSYDARPAALGGYFLLLGGSCEYPGVVKLDQNGAIEWQELFRYRVGQLVLLTTGFEPTPDGGYITTGSVASLNFPGHILALKVDSEGSLKGCLAIKKLSPNLTPLTPPSPQVSPTVIQTADTAVVPGGVTIATTSSELSPSNACLQF